MTYWGLVCLPQFRIADMSTGKAVDDGCRARVLDSCKRPSSIDQGLAWKYRAEQISKILKGVQWCEWINKKNNNILTALSTVQRNKVVNMECNFERRCVQKWSFLKEDVYKSGVILKKDAVKGVFWRTTRKNRVF